MNTFKIAFMGLLFFTTFNTEASANERYVQGTLTPIVSDLVSPPGLWLSSPCDTGERMTQGHLSADLCESAAQSSPTLFLDTGDCAPDIRIKQGSLSCQEINYNPKANAGVDQEVVTGSTVNLNGNTSSDDNSGDTLSYSWEIITKPSESTATLSGARTSLPSFTADRDGVYSVKLTVNDGELSDTDEVSITASTTLPADTTPPLITLNGNDPEFVLAGTNFEDPGATAEDNRDGSVVVETYSYINTFITGIYRIYYHATDSAGNGAETSRVVQVIDSMSLVAKDDDVEPESIQEVSVSVLSNDTYSDPSVRVALDYYQPTQGIWSVDGNKVVFTPNENFGGGKVGVNYRLIDNFGNSAVASVHIHYPAVFEAQDDKINSETIAQVTINVLSNDTVVEGSTVTVKIQNWEGTYTKLSTYAGVWEVVGHSITFTPKENYSGGEVSVVYEITDSEGHLSSAQIGVTYPIKFSAIEDFVTTETFTPIDVDVLANDIFSSLTVISNLWADSGHKGVWTIEDNQIRYTPDTNFGGGEVWAEYAIRNQEGVESFSSVGIGYPVIFQAFGDQSRVEDISHSANVDVLQNDVTIVGFPAAVEFISWNNEIGEQIFAEHVVTEDGEWQVLDGNVTFTPSQNFGGGTIYMQYRITDNDGHESQSGITIYYPAILRARLDQPRPIIIEETTIAVLNNDSYSNDTTITVELQIYNYEVDETIITDRYEVLNGVWSVVDNQVVFTPAENFGGGWVEGVSYILTDSEGRTSTAYISLEYPYIFHAVSDYVTSSTFDPLTFNIVENDITVEGLPVTVNNVTQETDQGNWSLDGYNVTFTPSATFGGGDVYGWYEITDEVGHTASGHISVNYPVILSANYDFLNIDTVIPKIIPVLDNDIIAQDAIVTIKLQGNSSYNETTGEWEYPLVDSYQTEEGNWSVVSNEVLFTPKSTFGGGYVFAQYQIKDQVGHISSNGININYPVILRTEYDNVYAESREPLTVTVLQNDTIAEGSSVTVQIVAEEWDEESEEWVYLYADAYESYEGNWTVVLNEVLFTPNAEWEGKYATISYRVTNQDGITSSAGISIELPSLLYAESDNYSGSDITQMVQIPVLDNDTAVDGKENLMLKLQYYDENWNTVYGESYETSDGVWSVTTDNTVEFVPSATFGGGYVSAYYQISDLHERTSETDININFPVVLYAEPNYEQPGTLAPVTVDVLSNDTYDHEGSPVTVMLENYFWDETGSHVNYVANVETYEGNWSVTADDEIEFIPSENFNGTYVQITYQITQDGRNSTTSVGIEYPIVIQAVNDYELPSEITEITLDVLNNDIIVNGLDKLELIYWDEGEVYADAYESFEGNWSVTLGDEVSFIPSSTFGGGYVETQYQITDTLGNSSQTSIGIEYDVILQAHSDENEIRDAFEIVTIDVLFNDVVILGKESVTVELITGYDENNNPILGVEVSQPDGIWSIDDQNNLIFTPNNNIFFGIPIYVNYQVTDSEGHKSIASVNFSYI